MAQGAYQHVQILGSLSYTEIYLYMELHAVTGDGTLRTKSVTTQLTE
jgi:hypothetical protein